MRSTGEGGEHLITPHLRILRRRKTIEKPRVHRRLRQLRHSVGHILDGQRQAHAAIGEAPAIPARHAPPPACAQRCCLRSQFRPQRQRGAQLVIVERKFLDAEEIQTCACGRALLEQLPGTQKIQPGAETGLADAETFTRLQRGKPARQIIPLQKHMARFFQTGIGRKIHIAVAF